MPDPQIQSSAGVAGASTPRALAGLVRLNVLLALALAAAIVIPALFSRGLEPAALAQSVRPRGQYLLVSGRLNGMPANAIYVFDTANQELVALKWEPSRNDLIGLGYRNVADDAKTAGGGR
ncbi:MAG: hypothetical protein AB7K52_13180 [Phycisphaerales bacterium]